jgi:SRSO17 transposase
MTTPVISISEGFSKFLNEFKEVFTFPQFKHLIQYCSGLLSYDGRKTITRINECNANKRDQSSLNRFLTSSPWNEEALNYGRIMMMNEKVEDFSRCQDDKTGFVILDDTTNPKKGEKMEFVGYNYSPLEGKGILSHCVVTSHLQYQYLDYPLLGDVYKKKEDCLREEEFRTKIQIATDQIAKVPLPQGIKLYTLVDAFYMCKAVVREAKKRGMESIGRLKSNRNISLNNKPFRSLSLHVKYLLSRKRRKDHGFRPITIKGDEGKDKRLWVHETIGYVSKLGLCKVLIIKERLRDKKEEPFFIASTDIGLSIEEIIDYYSKRWAIETFYEVSKENFGFDQYQMRKIKGIKRHWYLVFLVYSYLASIKAQGENLKTIGQLRRLEQHKNLILFVKWIHQKAKSGYSPNQIVKELKIAA